MHIMLWDEILLVTLVLIGAFSLVFGIGAFIADVLVERLRNWRQE